MFKKYNKYKLLKVFFDNPLENFRLRELSRLSGIAPLSVANYLKEFQAEHLVTRYEKRSVPFYRANRDDESFKLFKRVSILYELHVSGLIDYLWDTLAPEAIILFGSAVRGEDTEHSDIDIFIIGKEGKIDIGSYEKYLHKTVNILIESDKTKMSGEFKNNLINGIVLKGYLKLF